MNLRTHFLTGVLAMWTDTHSFLEWWCDLTFLFSPVLDTVKEANRVGEAEEQHPSY